MLAAPTQIALPDAPSNTVFFSGLGSFSRAAIKFQRGLMRGGRNELMWVDIDCEPLEVSALQLSVESVRERFVVTDDFGRPLQGLPAVAQLYRHTAGLRWVASILSQPFVNKIASRMFNRLALRLYARDVRQKSWMALR